MGQKLNNRSEMYSQICSKCWSEYFKFLLAHVNQTWLSSCWWRTPGSKPNGKEVARNCTTLARPQGLKPRTFLVQGSPLGALAKSHNPRGDLKCFQLWYYIIPHSLPHCSHSSQLSPILDLQIHPICFAKMFLMLFPIICEWKIVNLLEYSGILIFLKWNLQN